MNYTWEAVLEADKNLICREDLRFYPVNDGSPYIEIVLEDINTKNIDEEEIKVNPLYRFSEEFSDIFNINLYGFENVREMLFDIVMHYFVKLDLRQGLDRQEYYIRLLLDEIINGIYGNSMAESIILFDKRHLHRLLQLILKLYQCGSSICLFREVMRYLYPDSLVYASNEDVRQILIYAGRKETETERRKLEFLQGVFLPVYYRIYIFWEYHFGIIDVEETMELDNMVLF